MSMFSLEAAERLKEVRDLCADRVPFWELDDLVEAVDDLLASGKDNLEGDF